MQPQVSTAHYDFLKYESEARFSSYYHQVKCVLELNPESLLEIGVGGGIFLSLAKHAGLKTYSVDLDEKLKPSVAATVLNLPMKDNSVDVAVAFQILEHLPFDKFRQCLLELARVSKNGVVISLPDFGNLGMVISFPYVRLLKFYFRFLPFLPKHKFDGEHCWEINKKGFSLKEIISVIDNSGLVCEKTYLNPYNPYHRFFILKKSACGVSNG